jgi:TPR repeat protein
LFFFGAVEFAVRISMNRFRLTLVVTFTLLLLPTVVCAQAGSEMQQLLRKAVAGDAVAQDVLGSMYQDGSGVAKDASQAIFWYRKAAQQGYATAQKNLGSMYLYGDDVQKDVVQAASWLRKAADQDESTAQTLIGAMYAKGDGVPKDLVLAYQWTNLAAAKGGEHAIKIREVLEGMMTQAQIAEAQRLSREWKPKK